MESGTISISVNIDGAAVNMSGLYYAYYCIV